MDDISRIQYWIKTEETDECILTFNTVKVPEIGEEIYINTEMSESWYDARFPNRKLFRKGHRGDFKIVHVKRYYSVVDTTYKDGNYEFPTQDVYETFEVFLEFLQK